MEKHLNVGQQKTSWTPPTTLIADISPKPIRAQSALNSLQNFNLLPDAAYVRLPVVVLLFGVSPATVWRWAKKGLLPAPKRMASRTTAWNVGEIRRALTD